MVVPFSVQSDVNVVYTLGTDELVVIGALYVDGITELDVDEFLAAVHDW